MQRVKTSENFAEKKMFAEDTSEDLSEDRRYHFLLDFRLFLDIFEIFVEDCFLLRSFRKFLPSGFLPLSRFQISRDTAILSLRYPISRDTFQGRLALPQNGAIPHLGT